MTTTVQVGERIEVRLDAERREMLCQILAEQGGRLSDLVRHGIDLAYEEYLTARALEAVERLRALEGEENMPDPEELKRQIVEGRYGDAPEGWKP